MTAEDKPDENAPVNWRAKIEGNHLRNFCLSFLEFIDREVCVTTSV
jgi:hypothetical protein